MKTFTDDETGEKYELVGEYANPGTIIKPIQPKEEEDYYFISIRSAKTTDQVGITSDNWFNFDVTVLTKPQAKAIAAWIEAGIEYMQKPGLDIEMTGGVRNMLMAARKAMQDNK